MLLRKMLRDMRSNLSSFISIFIMAILAAFVYSGINAEWYGMQNISDNYYDETNLPDIWITGSDFTQEDVKIVKQLNGITNVTLRLCFDSPVEITSSDNQSDILLRLNIMDENNTVSTPKVVAGSPLNSASEGLWLDEYFAKANKLKTGDTISLEISGERLQVRVLGLILHPEYVYKAKDGSTFLPDHKSFGFAYLYSSFFDQFSVTNYIPYNQLLITLNDEVHVDTVIKELENIYSDRYSIIIDRDNHPSVSAFNSEIEQNKAMGGVFPVVFFLISALSMLTTMTRMTNSQRILIGTLKALGFSKKRILFHYISYGIWLGLVGGLIGLFTGPLVIPPILFAMQKTIYTLPQWSIAISPSSIHIVILLVLCCGASSYLACHGQLKEMPASSLRPKASKHIRHNPLEKSKLWLSLDFSIQWNLRDIWRSRIRSVMAVIGVTGCTALLIFGFGLRDTVNNVSSLMYKELNLYESKINLVENPSKEAQDSISKSYSGQWIMEASIELRNDNNKENGSLTVLDIGDKMHFKDYKNRLISLPEEGIAISSKMAELLGIRPGDTVEWRLYGEKEWIRSIATLTYRTPMGQGLSLTRREYEGLGKRFMPTALLTSEFIEDNGQLKAIKNIQNKNSLIDDFNNMLESMKMIIVILVLGSLLLGSVVLYNLGALSFTEKTRELATLKVLGFFPKQIRSLLQLQNLWLTLLGILIGIPTGCRLVSFMLSTMPASLDMVPSISLLSLLFSITVTLIISVAVNWVLSKNISKIDMVSALKSVE